MAKITEIAPNDSLGEDRRFHGDRAGDLIPCIRT
jgi:hypothetical protein